MLCIWALFSREGFRDFIRVSPSLECVRRDLDSKQSKHGSLISVVVFINDVMSTYTEDLKKNKKIQAYLALSSIPDDKTLPI